MEKQIIKINEQQLKQIVAESVKKALNEIGDTKRGQYLMGRVAGRTLKRDAANNKPKIGFHDFCDRNYMKPTKDSWNHKRGEFYGDNEEDIELNAYKERKGNEKERDMAKSFYKGEKDEFKSKKKGKITK